jgi:ubiquinone/menaquinone biosynthesis C-methylase UbiE
MQTSQRLDEWKNNLNIDYFDRQFVSPYRSTVKFCEWLELIGAIETNSTLKILDIGTGKGSNIYYMNQRFPLCNYLGLDISDELVIQGNAFMKEQNMVNCKLEYADLYSTHLQKYKDAYNGIVSYQTLSWLPECETALKNMIALNPDWIALTSLFYDGLIDCKIEVKEFQSADDNLNVKASFYNIYSLPRIEKLFYNHGYKVFKFIPFEIDIDLPKPEHNNMQTYTQKMMDGTRLQISGPVLMNWHFIYAAKE